ncbi:MAG: PAS domain S-box protein [Magnetovibrio sp.]|nr:PAS domain S-box protein [Magnetovibrio sp.]
MVFTDHDKRRIKVLLVEDEDHHAELVSRAIEDSDKPFELVVATNIRQARQYLIDHDPDVVLTDNRLPDGHGIELLPGLDAIQTYPVVLMTSQGNESLAVEAMKAGAMDYLVKSHDTFEAIPRILHRVLREAQYDVEKKQAASALKILNQDLALQVEEHKQTARELSKLSQAVEQSPHMMYITDLKAKIQYINAKFSEMTGYTKKEVYGKNASILNSGDSARELYQDLWETIQKGDVWRNELKDKRKNGSVFWAMVSISPIISSQDEITHYVAVHEDITERKSVESSMHQAVLEADVANKTKTELLANMSHELRTPLNAIIGFSSSIQAEIFGPLHNEKYKEYINDIGASGQHLLELINDILDVSAIEAGKLDLNESDLEIQKLVESSVRLVQHRARQGEVDVQFKIADNLPGFHADERRMKQILLNVLSNAVKFTSKKGSVKLAVFSHPEHGLTFSIIDTGVGMDEIELIKAKLPFGQVNRGHHSKHEGTGLGLPLTKGLIELHGGTLEIISNKGIGTEVIISFNNERVTAL